MKRRRWLIVISLVIFSGNVGAANILNKINWNGFASLYGNQALDNNTEAQSSKDVGFIERSKIGLNMRSDFTDQMAAVGQFVAKGHHKAAGDRAPDWKVKADWAFLHYKPGNHFSIRLGRQLLPGWVDAEYQDIGQVFPYVGLPQHIMNISPVKAFNGLSLEYRFDIGRYYDLYFRILGGNESEDYAFASTSITGDLNVETKNIFGGSIVFSGDWVTFIYRYLRAKINSTLNAGTVVAVGVTGGAGQTVNATGVGTTIPLSVNSVEHNAVGFKVDRYNFVIYAEYGHLRGKDGTDMASVTSNVMSGQYLNKARGGYGFVGYRLGDVTPYYMYSKSDWDIGLQTGRHYNHTVGANIKLNEDTVTKFEYTHCKAKGGNAYVDRANERARTVTFGMDFVF